VGSALGPSTSRLRRAWWFALGWSAVAIGSIGIIVPGLPTTVFFIVAASCFARSSPRFEQWVLALPRVGPMVRDHRAGLGMSRRAKVYAVATMVVFAAVGIVVGVDHPALIGLILTLVAVGAAYVIFRVPTRERVLAQRHEASDAGS
jgi:uncharacterized membrane protein YbaN (DUF454 family)